MYDGSSEPETKIDKLIDKAKNAKEKNELREIKSTIESLSLKELKQLINNKEKLESKFVLIKIIERKTIQDVLEDEYVIRKSNIKERVGCLLLIIFFLLLLVYYIF